MCLRSTRLPPENQQRPKPEKEKRRQHGIYEETKCPMASFISYYCLPTCIFNKCREFQIQGFGLSQLAKQTEHNLNSTARGNGDDNMTQTYMVQN